MLSLLVSSCTDDDVTGYGNVPLQVSVTANSPLVSRAIVTDDYLPDKSSIGLSLYTPEFDKYDGQDYQNIKFTAAGTGDTQVWTAAAEISVSANEAHLLAYWPYNGDLQNDSEIPVETATQTDYMYSGLVTGISNAKPQADITMNHALTAVRVKLVLGDYTGSVDVSNVSVASPALGTAAVMDAYDGKLSDVTGQGDAVALDVDFGLTAEGISTDIMLVPDKTVVTGITKVAATIGGKKFAANVPVEGAYLQGYVYTYVIKLNNTGFEITKVAVNPWSEGGTQEGEFEFTYDDDEYVTKILIENDNSMYNHNALYVNGTIDWGDGNVETFTEETERPAHEYEKAGLYTVVVKGTVQELESTNFGYGMDTNYIKEIVHIGKGLGIKDVVKAFQQQQFLDKIYPGVLDGCYNVTDFSNTFYGCESLTTIPEGLFDACTEVTSFGGIFNGCKSLMEIPAGLFDNCTKVENFGSTFYGCTSLTEIPEGLFDNNIKVTSFEGTFSYCTALQAIPEGLFDHCTEVTSFRGTFSCNYGDSKTMKIKSIPKGLFDKCTKVTDFYGTFSKCSSLQEIPEGLFDKCTKVTNFYYTFYRCSSLTGESPYTLVDGVKVHLYERKNYPEYFTVPTKNYECFYKCTGLTDYENIPTGWK